MSLARLQIRQAAKMAFAKVDSSRTHIRGPYMFLETLLDVGMALLE